MKTNKILVQKDHVKSKRIVMDVWMGICVIFDASMAFLNIQKGNYYTEGMTHTALALLQQFSMWSNTHMLPSLILCEHLLLLIVALVTSVC